MVNLVETVAAWCLAKHAEQLWGRCDHAETHIGTFIWKEKHHYVWKWRQSSAMVKIFGLCSCTFWLYLCIFGAKWVKTHYVLQSLLRHREVDFVVQTSVTDSYYTIGSHLLPFSHTISLIVWNCPPVRLADSASVIHNLKSKPCTLWLVLLAFCRDLPVCALAF